MKNEDYFDVLIRNYRLLEACGFIGALVNKGLLDEDRGKHIEELLRTYNYIIVNNMLNDNGVNVLTLNNYKYSDLDIEVKRVCKVISSNTKKYPLINSLLVAYVALVNEDLSRVEQQFSALIEEIGKISPLDPKEINPLGTYDCFIYLSNAIENIYNLPNPVLAYINKYALKIEINRTLLV